MQELIALLLAMALHFAPPEKHTVFKGYEETAEQARARYLDIVTDIAEATKHLENPKRRATFMLAWAIGESGLYKDADIGPCHRSGAWKTRCDSGLAAGIWQMHAHTDVFDKKTWRTTEWIFSNRGAAAKEVSFLMNKSWNACAGLPEEDRMSAFGIGRCVEGNKSVRRRYKLWLLIRDWKPTAS
jgi:hypothetical protein